MGSGLIVDRQVCRKIKEQKGKDSLASSLLQSLSHSLFLAPSSAPLGLSGLFVPAAGGIFFARTEKMYLVTLLSFITVYVISFCIHRILAIRNAKSEQGGSGQSH